MRSRAKTSDALLFGLDRPVAMRACDCAGCSEAGLYRAPKSRDQLNDYFWFCLDHVRVYNAKWDYYAGMSEAEVEAHTRKDVCWERETWPMGASTPGAWRRAMKAADALRENARREFFADREEAGSPREAAPAVPAMIIEALSVLGLKPPVEFALVKAHYRALVKQHHPDRHGGSAEAEERIKSINQAFTTLRALYESENA